MQKILWKRVLRDLKTNAFRYFTLGLLIVLCMYLIVSLVATAETVIGRGGEMAEEYHLEDGQFTTFTPLTGAQKNEIEAIGTSLEEMFYLDFAVEPDDTLRLFKNREEIDQIVLETGRTAEKSGEVVLEKRYAAEHQEAVGDSVEIGGKRLEVVGIGTVPDYDAPYKELSDSSVDSKHFGLAFVTMEQYNSLQEKGSSTHSESYTYAYIKSDKVKHNEIKEFLQGFEIFPEEAEDSWFQEDRERTEIKNLIQFLPAEDNPRIMASADDQVINKIAGMIAGIIVLVLFSYVISVFTIHSIEEESSIIGSLYALGVRKRELIFHYLSLPVILTTIAGGIGTAFGFSRWGLDVQIQECYDYFSVPRLEPVYPVYLLIYGILVPPALAALVNYFVMNKKLGRPALSLMQKEQKGKNTRNIALGDMGFIGSFCIRQMLREIRSLAAVILGMFFSLLILMLGVNCYVMCEHISEQSKEDTKYQYMYTYKYPTEQAPEDGGAAYAVTLQKENLRYRLDVTLLGIEDDNPYFDVDVQKGENKIVLSSAAAQKFQLKSGDQLVLMDKENDKGYAFTVEGVTQYSTGLYAFMDIESLRKLFGQEENYYNVVLSDKELDIPAGCLYAATSKDDIIKSSNVFIDMMMPMICMMIGVAVFVFCIVMYLMMKVMLDRSSYGISLVKVFGYRAKEIKKLYLNGNFYIIALGAAVTLPLSKKIMDGVYPILVANVTCAMDLSFTWQMYVGIYIAVLLLYLVINQMLVGKLKKIMPAEILKDRE